MRKSAAERGVKQTVVYWIGAMLKSRTILDEIGGLSLAITVIRGCCQSYAMSPPLWCLKIDSLLHRLKEWVFVPEVFLTTSLYRLRANSKR